MKKLTTNFSAILIAIILLASCKNPPPPPPPGANNNGLTEADFNTVLDKMKDDGEIEDKEFKKIKAKLQETKSNKAKNSTNKEPNDTTGALIVNSLTFFKDIYSDRSLNLNKYLNKPLIITDLVLVDVFTENEGEEFTKCASAFPYDPKSGIMAVGSNKFFGYGDLNLTTESPTYSFNEQPIYNIDLENFTKANSKKPIKIKFKNADELKKMNMLEWENNEGDNYTTKINISCTVNKENISYRPGSEDKNNIKAFEINVTFADAEIIKK